MQPASGAGAGVGGVRGRRRAQVWTERGVVRVGPGDEGGRVRICLFIYSFSAIELTWTLPEFGLLIKADLYKWLAFGNNTINRGCHFNGDRLG